MNETLLKTNRLCRHYQRGKYTVRAVDEVTLSIASGEFTAVVGSSGSGKSTLLNLLAGLDSPTSGTVGYRERTLNAMSRKELAAYRAGKVGMIFQSFNLLNHQTALKNVELALYFDHTPRGERETKARAMLDRLGLADRTDHKPSDLSGGEQQRVAIARALVKSPEILFADEPTGNLDQANSDSIAELLKELHRGGLTIVMVTHDRDLAQKTSARIIRMNYGKIVPEEAP